MFMQSKMCSFINNDKGQSLVEAPLIICTLTCMVIMLIQPCLSFTTRAMVGFACASLSRVDATASTSSEQERQSVYRQYVEHKMGALPKTPYFYIPSSIEIKSGSSTDASVRDVEISVEQKPLPLIGAFLADDDGLIHITEKTSVYDSLAFSQTDENEKDLVVGAE